MRIRTIKPSFWTNEKLAELSDFERLLAIGLLNYADDRGFFWANSKMIRGSLFPFEEDSKKILKAAERLAAIGYIQLGTTRDGRSVGKIVHFNKHQRVDKPQPSEIEELAQFDLHSENVPGAVVDHSTGDRKGMEGNGIIPLPLEAEPEAKDSRHHEITSRWGELFANAFGLQYNFDGHDAAALKRFLRTSRDSPDEFLGVAVKAWERGKVDPYAKRCLLASSIAKLCRGYNEIRVELQAPRSSTPRGSAPLPDVLTDADVERINRSR